MATHRIPIIGWNSRPDNTGECFPESYDVLATNKVWDHLIYRFGSNNAAQPTVRHGLFGMFEVPPNYASGPKIIVLWTSTLTTGAVVWDFEYRSVGGGESYDQAGTEESDTLTDTAPGTAHIEIASLFSALTAGNFAVSDMIEFYLARDAAEAADTLAGSAILQGAFFEYSD